MSQCKEISTCDCIVQAVRPKTAVASIPFALGVMVDHVTGSQYVVKLLPRLGPSVSYDEVVCFKQSVTQCDSVDPQQSCPECFTQYVADNLNHDVCTLDGKGTLYYFNR